MANRLAGLAMVVLLAFYIFALLWTEASVEGVL